jgi:hypothetical protein
MGLFSKGQWQFEIDEEYVACHWVILSNNKKIDHALQSLFSWSIKKIDAMKSYVHEKILWQRDFEYLSEMPKDMIPMVWNHEFSQIREVKHIWMCIFPLIVAIFLKNYESLSLKSSEKTIWRDFIDKAQITRVRLWVTRVKYLA